MKKFKIVIATIVLSAGLASCSSAYYASTGYASDDLYAVHDKTQIARKKQAEAEAQRAAAEARKAEWEARIAEAQAAAAENDYYEYRSSDSNPYLDVLADDYESAYARRLRGFESPSYKMPSSYINARYSSAFNYVSAYDPAFYNIIISGDQVWVEPKYVTSMFGNWGTVVYADPWYYGWNRPWGPSFSIGSWGWSFGWNSWNNPWYGPWGPWYSSWYGPGWGHGWGHGWGPGWHGGHWHGGYGGHGNHWSYRSNNYRGRGVGASSRYDPGRSSSGLRYGGSSASDRYSRGGTSSGGRGGTVYQSGGRNGNTSVYRGSGSRGSSSSNSSTWNSNRNDSYRNNSGSSSSSSRGSYNSGSSSSGSYSGGSRGGSSSGGSSGGSRGGSSSGGSRGYGGR